MLSRVKLCPFVGAQSKLVMRMRSEVSGLECTYANDEESAVPFLVHFREVASPYSMENPISC